MQPCQSFGRALIAFGNKLSSMALRQNCTPRSSGVIGLLVVIFLELGGWQVTQAGMQALLVIDGLQEVADLHSGIGKGVALAQVDLLILQRLHEALGFAIVIQIAPMARVLLEAC